MFLNFLFILVIWCSNSGDSLRLPIKNGRIIQTRSNADKFTKSILISPTDDFHIRSCINGKIFAIKVEEWGYDVAVNSDSVLIIYSGFDSLNAVDVKIGNNIKQSDVIGWKKSVGNEEYIILTVFINGHEVDPKKYLIWN